MSLNHSTKKNTLLNWTVRVRYCTTLWTLPVENSSYLAYFCHVLVLASAERAHEQEKSTAPVKVIAIYFG